MLIIPKRFTDIEDFNLTYSEYVNKKYKEFYDKNGYIPEIFNPYNCCELSDYAPTLTAQGDSITKSGTVLIICENIEWFYLWKKCFIFISIYELEG